MRNYTQYGVPVFLIIIVALLLVPLPAILLDLFLISNLAVALLVVILSASIKRPSEFSVFPALLLVLTLGRLSLNVASTRMILTKGAAFDSIFIKAFGNWVIAGDYVVGAVIFLILVVIQFMVITAGAERVAEVSARFRLEALPMKQMGIESALSSGSLDEETAAFQRKELQTEMDFYGAMDGASKFIKGETLASLFIVAINCVGGITAGVLNGGFSSVGQLFQTYVLLTIGDGLVGLIPSLFVSIAAGLIITRSSSEGDLSSDLASQLGAHSHILVQTLGIISILMVVLGLFAGVAPVPFLILGFMFAGVAYMIQTAPDNSDDGDNVSGDSKDDAPVVRGMVYQVELFISHDLWEKWNEDNTLDHLRALSAKVCDKVYKKRGIPLTPIELSSTDEFQVDEFALYLRGDEVLSGKIDLDGIMAVGRPGERVDLDGSLTRSPDGTGRARWITSDLAEEAVKRGYRVLNASDVLTEKVYSAIVAHGNELLGLQEMDEIWNGVAHHFPAIARSLEEANVDRVLLLEIMKGLAEEGISIRNSGKIFESVVHGLRATKNVDQLIDIVRCDLSRQISKELADANDVIHAVVLAPETEEEIRASLSEAGDGVVTPFLPPYRADEFLRSLSSIITGVKNRGLVPVLMVSSDLRRILYLYCEPRVRGIVVLSCSEVDPSFSLNPTEEVCLSEVDDGQLHDIHSQAYREAEDSYESSEY